MRIRRKKKMPKAFLRVFFWGGNRWFTYFCHLWSFLIDFVNCFLLFNFYYLSILFGVTISAIMCFFLYLRQQKRTVLGFSIVHLFIN